MSWGMKSSESDEESSSQLLCGHCLAVGVPFLRCVCGGPVSSSDSDPGKGGRSGVLGFCSFELFISSEE